MPRISDSKLLQQAISPAVRDRKSLADAYSNQGEHAIEANQHARAFGALRGKELTNLSADDKETARLCFIFAEQWEVGLSEALRQSDPKLAKCAAGAAEQYRQARTRLWGPTKLEAALARATTVPVTF